MAASVRIEASAFDDPRFTILARSCGIADRDLALMKCVRVWSYATDKETHTLRRDIIDIVAGVENFADSMINADLAEEKSSGVYLKGGKDNLLWLATKRKNSRKGGEARRAKTKPIGLPPASKNEAEPKPKPSPITIAPAIALTTATALAKNKKPKEKKDTPGASPPDPEEPSEHSAFVSAFDTAFRGRHNGTKPTWKAQDFAQVKRLLSQHGLESCLLRVEHFFHSRPPWPEGYDFGTLVAHFDKFASPYRKPRDSENLTARDIWDMSNESSKQHRSVFDVEVA